MILGMIVVEVLAVPFSSLFGLSGETQDICISAMRINRKVISELED